MARPSWADQVHSKKTSVKPPPPVPQMTPPAVPLTLQQQPASPPQVAFQDGELTITAQNSVLGEILRAVRSQTGANVDVPSNATERVVGRFGPGPARNVLASLLNGSSFNYVLLGSATNPAGLDRVMLFPKTGGPDAPNASAQAEPPPRPTPPILTPGGVPPRPGSDNTEGTGENGTNDEFGDDMAEQDQLQQQQQQEQAAQAEEQQQGQPQSPFNGPPGIKTPEQLLQELQQRQQQQQQGVPGAPPNQPQP